MNLSSQVSIQTSVSLSRVKVVLKKWTQKQEEAWFPDIKTRIVREERSKKGRKMDRLMCEVLVLLLSLGLSAAGNLRACDR